jgi:hypothetical protein
MAGVPKRRRQGANFETLAALVTSLYPGDVVLGTEGAHRYPKRIQGPDGIAMKANKNHIDSLVLHHGEVSAPDLWRTVRRMLGLTRDDVLGDPCAARCASLIFLVLATGCRGVASEIVPDRYDQAVEALQIADNAAHEGLATLSRRITLHPGNMIFLASKGCFDDVTKLWLADVRIDPSVVKRFETYMADRMTRLETVVKMQPIGCGRAQRGVSPASILCRRGNGRASHCDCRCEFFKFDEESNVDASWANGVRVIRYTVTHPNSGSSRSVQTGDDAYRIQVALIEDDLRMAPLITRGSKGESVTNSSAEAQGNGIEFLPNCRPENPACGEEARSPCACREVKQIVLLQRPGKGFFFRGSAKLHRSIFDAEAVVASWQFFMNYDLEGVRKPRRPSATNVQQHVEIQFDAKLAMCVTQHFLSQWFGDLATFLPLLRVFNSRKIDVDRTRELNRAQLLAVAGSFAPLAQLIEAVERTCSNQKLGSFKVRNVWIVLKSDQPGSGAVTAFPDYHVDYKIDNVWTLILVGAVLDALRLAKHLDAAKQAKARVAEAVLHTHAQAPCTHARAQRAKR